MNADRMQAFMSTDRSWEPVKSPAEALQYQAAGRFVVGSLSSSDSGQNNGHVFIVMGEVRSPKTGRDVMQVYDSRLGLSVSSPELLNDAVRASNQDKIQYYSLKLMAYPAGR